MTATSQRERLFNCGGSTSALRVRSVRCDRCGATPNSKCRPPMRELSRQLKRFIPDGNVTIDSVHETRLRRWMLVTSFNEVPAGSVWRSKRASKPGGIRSYGGLSTVTAHGFYRDLVHGHLWPKVTLRRENGSVWDCHPDWLARTWEKVSDG